MHAVRNLFPPECWDNIVFRRQSLYGHHKNPIVLFGTRIKDKQITRAFVENLSANLSTMDKQILIEDIGRHVEKGSLYLRLDKQAALKGNLRLSKADPIRVRVRFRKNKLEGVIQICQELGILP